MEDFGFLSLKFPLCKLGESKPRANQAPAVKVFAEAAEPNKLQSALPCFLCLAAVLMKAGLSFFDMQNYF